VWVITEPLSVEFMQRALAGGLLVAVLCAVTGTWVVLRGMAFLGEAMAHGMLPGVAIAVVLGLPGPAGAAVAAGGMAAGIGLATRRGGLSQDTAIGLLFVGMLALGVVIVSAVRTFPVDLSAILFGDILALQGSDLAAIGLIAPVVIATFALSHRPLTALSFDPRIAQTLGLRPRLAGAVLLGGIAVSIVASYRSVGTLLVVGLLVAPPAAAAPWARSVSRMMLLAAAIGGISVLVGLLVSWHASWAAGAAIALTAIAAFVGSVTLHGWRERRVGARFDYQE
jgi:ABC-type Mn2+/Zn2+ transport system permease subunit